MKKVILITANRSDFGIQRKLIKLLQKEKKFKFYLVATGAHLEKKYGNTISEIKKDKIKITKKIKVKVKNYNTRNVMKIFANSSLKFFDYYEKIKPNLVIILGDRYEMLAATIPTITLNIPVAHIHGGERTQGSFDDCFRNMITDIASLHFTCHDIYKKRVCEIKSSNKNIYNFGSLSIEDIHKFNFQTKKFLENKFKIKFASKNILLTYHPETKNKKFNHKSFGQILKAIINFKDINFFFTLPAPDPGNLSIIKQIQIFCKKRTNCYFVPSFGKNSYFSMLNYIDGVIGNSSSGIIEVPSFKIPTINIGNRQTGRLLSKSVISCECKKNVIQKNINKIFTKNFKKKIKNTKNIFFKKNTAANILKKIKDYLNEK